MDTAGFEFLNSLAAHNPTLRWLAIALAKYGVFFYALLLVWLWVNSTNDRHRGMLLLAVAACALALGMNVILNIIAPRPRPYLTLPATVLVIPPHDPSFPSDHAAIASAVSTNLLLCGEPEWGALALLVAFIIGAARVAVGVHYPSDIIGGVMVGAAFAFASLAFYPSLRPVLDAVIRIARRFHLARCDHRANH
jgi:undecaprenyl-diphosphatase